MVDEELLHSQRKVIDNLHEAILIKDLYINELKKRIKELETNHL